ncbi:MAG: hypothetical protein ACFFBD_08335 [Candidatus Hodarchaeota archaeon]
MGSEISNPHQQERLHERKLQVKKTNSHNEEPLTLNLGWIAIIIVLSLLIAWRFIFQFFNLISLILAPLAMLHPLSAAGYNIGVYTILLLYLGALIGFRRKKTWSTVFSFFGAGIDLTLGILGLVILWNLSLAIDITNELQYFRLGIDALDIVLLLVLMGLSVIEFRALKRFNRGRRDLPRTVCLNCKKNIHPNIEICPHCGVPVDEEPES